MNEYLRFSFRVLDILGVFHSGSEFSNRGMRIFVFMSSTVLLFISGSIELTNTYQNFSKFNDILSLVWFGMMGISRYLTMLYYRQRITTLRDVINENKINDDTSVEDDLILAKYDKKGQRSTRIMSAVIFSVGVGIFLQNMPTYIRSNILTLPVEIYYPFNLDQMGWFVLAYAHQCVAYVTFILIFMAFSGQFIGLTFHSCGHYRVLQNYIERIAEDENWVEYSKIDMRKRIAKIVELHQNILRMNEDMEDFSSYPNLIQFLVSAVGLCTSTYELTSGHVSPEQMLKHVAGVVGQFAELFIDNYCGQLLQDTSYEVSKAISRSNFYNIKLGHQKDLNFILARAQKPMYLTAGKFCILSLQNIINILKATTTYFAMFATLDSQSDA